MTENLGFRPENVFLLKDGETLVVEKSQASLGNQVRLNTIIVDGKGIGDVGKIVLADRKKMADDGMVIVVLTVNNNNKQVLTDPEIITRGFVYVRRSQEFIDSLQKEVWQVLGPSRQIQDTMSVRDKVTERLEQFIYHETERRPMILTVIIKI